MGDKLKDLFETVRTCPMHFNNAGEEKIFYAGWWPLKEMRWAEEDIDKSNKDGYEEMHLTEDLHRIDWKVKT